MNGDTLFTIGDLARRTGRTGRTVKAIRFYSDTGIVPPTDRSPAGYRLYDIGVVIPSRAGTARCRRPGRRVPRPPR